jgi:RNA polymerase sigma factor (sigma-70 family)
VADQLPPGASGPGDADLAVAAARGDRDALGLIYDRYAPRVHSLALRQLRDAEAAADVTQETFLQAATRLGGLRDPERLGAWLFAVTRHEIVNHVRRARRDLVTSTFEDHDMPIESTQGFDRLHDEELRTLIAQAQVGLDDRDRLVLDLAYGQELAGAGIAAALGVREDNAHQLLSRARTRMRSSLGALLVARRGRTTCGDLDALLSGWNGRFSTVWRKRVARHVAECDRCTATQHQVLSPAALCLAFPVVALPGGLREQVLSRVHQVSATTAPPSGTGGQPWTGEGFPPDGPGDLAVLASRSGGAPAPVPGAGAARRLLTAPRALPVAAAVALLVVVAAMGGSRQLLTNSPEATASPAISASSPTSPVPPTTRQAAAPASATTAVGEADPLTRIPSPSGASSPPGRPSPSRPASQPPVTTDPATPEPVGPELTLGSPPEPLWAPGNPSATLTLANTGDAPASWSARAEPKGLTVTPSSGTLAPGETAELTVSIPRSGPPSSGPGQLTVTAPGAEPVAVSIRFLVPG